MTLDEARAANPDLAFGLYAMEPGGPVTLEVMTPDGDLYSWSGPTEADVLAKAFPPAPATPPEAEPTASIFD